MAVLNSWYMNADGKGRICLEGRVEGHERMPDGMLIHTTPILSFVKEKDGLIAKTRNTTYKLPLGVVNIRKHRGLVIDERVNGENLIYYGRLLRILAENMQMITQLDEMNKIELHNVIGDPGMALGTAERMICDIREMMEAKYKRLEMISQLAAINDGELWLEVGSSTPSLFRLGLVKYEGNEYLLEEVSIHIGMFQNSVLIKDKNEAYDLRYIPRKDTVDLYKWEGVIQKVKIYNSGEQAMSVIWGCKKIHILPGTTQWLFYEA